MGVRPWICITWLFLNDSSCLFSKKKTQWLRMEERSQSLWESWRVPGLDAADANGELKLERKQDHRCCSLRTPDFVCFV